MYERGVIFCLGRITGAKGPGLSLITSSSTAWPASPRNSAPIFPLPMDIVRLVDMIRSLDGTRTVPVRTA
ncbi:hypothetical protein [Streptomyces lavendulocolor]|uniref:hypothetical protein n=1 Tax=Streptomyces lavendulocolor TaxID=67316 RepID=UPI003C2E09FC